MERYVAEALAGRAEWAPILAAAEFDLTEVVGNGMHSAGPSIGAIAGVVSKQVKAEVDKQRATEGKLSRGSKRKDTVLTKMPDPPAPEPVVVAPACAASCSTARSFIRSTRTGVGHLVRFCGDGLRRHQWETGCGWKYGKARHEACDANAVSCTRCKLALRA